MSHPRQGRCLQVFSAATSLRSLHGRDQAVRYLHDSLQLAWMCDIVLALQRWMPLVLGMPSGVTWALGWKRSSVTCYLLYRVSSLCMYYTHGVCQGVS